ncbi:crossover junction endodeoxyribonuclease RuvC [Patescibacteria group bacterium]|nr:crossover junction endodeoxyribonuclease RuvC [Patescibacteria group bacterium]MBU1721533.1 crossover junction endodeoxyribonuclease RuvC [Patescibacteria group bacterium]MBU1901499.1 crossover junction endodeoxyribonuclease RuvC [Patescibacteria group bacterium]
MKQTKKIQRILGIDPGFGRVGYGIIEGSGSQWTHVTHGCIETAKENSFVDRLVEVQTDLQTIIDMYQPSIACVEELFFLKNVTTGMNVSHARGVILLTLHQAGIDIHEATPLEIKQAITGYGQAHKEQVQYMVAKLLKLPETRLQDDAADALGAALYVSGQLAYIQKTTK